MEEGLTNKTVAQAEMFANRLKKRLSHLRKWAKRTGTGAFRLYDRDIPEIPLVLDLYGDIVSGALYKRPYEKDEAEETAWLEAMRAAASQALGMGQDNIIIKRRERQQGLSQYEKISGRSLVRTVVEGGLKFQVNLSDYLDTGLFPDRRALRRIVRADSTGKRVLNLFCYTASFSVYSADDGATSTDSVDLSNTYLGWAQKNFSLNGLKAEILRKDEYFSLIQGKGSGEWGVGSKGRYSDDGSTPVLHPNTSAHAPTPYSLLPTPHTLIRADVPLFLQKAAAGRQQWDIIVLDPPAFSNSTMASADFDLQRDHEKLLADCLTLLAPGGKLFFSAGARSFKAKAEDIEKRHPGITVTDIGSKIIDEDFKGRKTPKAFLVGSG
jgi:23S rRNA G2069 N7-methylase RlmK/C1962 C5-methylase RlmI